MTGQRGVLTSRSRIRVQQLDELRGIVRRPQL